MSHVPAILSGPSPFIRFLISSPLTHSFDSYCAQYDKDPVNGAYDLESLKDLMNEVAYGMDGIEGEGCPPSLKSVRQSWKDFTAQFRRENDLIPPNTTLSSQMYASPSMGSIVSLPTLPKDANWTLVHKYHHQRKAQPFPSTNECDDMEALTISSVWVRRCGETIGIYTRSPASECLHGPRS
jgi:hypothetical protein